MPGEADSSSLNSGNVLGWGGGGLGSLGYTQQITSLDLTKNAKSISRHRKSSNSRFKDPWELSQ